MFILKLLECVWDCDVTYTYLGMSCSFWTQATFLQMTTQQPARKKVFASKVVKIAPRKVTRFRCLHFLQTRYLKLSIPNNGTYFLLKLAGHSGNFKAGKNQGTVLKKCCPQEENCYKQFHNDSLHDYVPDYQGTLVLDDDESKN